MAGSARSPPCAPEPGADVGQLRWLARRLAVHQPVRALSVEREDPVRPGAPVVDLGHSKEAKSLRRILRRLRGPPLAHQASKSVRSEMGILMADLLAAYRF